MLSDGAELTLTEKSSGGDISKWQTSGKDGDGLSEPESLQTAWAWTPGQEGDVMIGSESPSTSGDSVPHNDDPLERCRCGCVPNIMSLFEMAELRAKRRKERAEAEALLRKKEEEVQRDRIEEVTKQK